LAFDRNHSGHHPPSATASVAGEVQASIDETGASELEDEIAF